MTVKIGRGVKVTRTKPEGIVPFWLKHIEIQSAMDRVRADPEAAERYRQSLIAKGLIRPVQ